jgi:protocatechuate 3,4-dioxygenase beta subunit
VSGVVKDTAGTPLEGVLDIWQADEKGVYDNDGFKLRGKIIVDDTAVRHPRLRSELQVPSGAYSFQTIMPGDYQIADNPPDFRCAHIHVKVTAEGYKPLTTQLYFPDDQYNATDHWFDRRRVIQHPIGTFDFVLEKLL